MSIRTADLPTIATPTDASKLVADKATSTGVFTALALKTYMIAGLGTAASVTAEAAARVAARTALSAAEYGVVGDGVTDDTAALQAAIDAATAAAMPLFIPEGRYLISAALTVKRGVRIFGAGSEPFVQAFSADPAIPGEGTWIVLDGSDLVSVFNIAPAGIASAINQVFGVELSHFGIWHTQPGGTDTPGWAPYNYPAAISLGGASDIHLHDITLLNPTVGIKTVAEGGRLTIERIRGQPLTNAIILDNQTDVVRVKDCHFWVYWSLDTPVLDWQKTNTVVYQLGRVDNPVFDGNFAIWCHIGVQCVKTASGVTSLASFQSCGFDQCGYLCVINDATGGHSLFFVNCYAQGDPPHAEVASGILIVGAGSGNTVRLTDCLLRSYNRNIAYISASGTGNRIRFTGGCWLSDWDQIVGGHTAFWAEPGNSIWADPSTMMSSTQSPTLIYGGTGFVTKAAATQRRLCHVVSGTTASVDGVHTLGRAPDAIMLQPRGTLGAGVSYWWTATATTFVVHTAVDPGIDVYFDALLIVDDSF